MNALGLLLFIALSKYNVWKDYQKLKSIRGNKKQANPILGSILENQMCYLKAWPSSLLKHKLKYFLTN